MNGSVRNVVWQRVRRVVARWWSTRLAAAKVPTYRALEAAVCLLPLNVGYGLARVSGAMLAQVPTKRRAAVRQNLAVVFEASAADSRVRDATRRAITNALLNYLDLLRLGSAVARERLRHIVVPDWRPIEDALGAGHGVILVSAHLGNIDTVVQILALRGWSTLIVVEQLEPPAFFAFMRAQRAALGLDIEPVGPSVFRLMTARLRANGIVVIVGDRDIQGTGQEATFFGRRVSLPSAPVLLSLRTGAPIVCAFGYRYADGNVSARLAHPLALQRSTSLRQDIASGTQQIARMIEAEIKREPAQWVVQQPIFSTPRPPAQRRSVDQSARAGSTGHVPLAPMPKWLIRLSTHAVVRMIG